jgi:ADP-ribose pyrophosphatase
MTYEPQVPRPASKQKRGAEAEVVFKGKLFDVWQWQQRLFDGRMATFEMLSRPDTVLILPIRADGQALFVNETQPGTAAMLRTIGGRIEPGELPEQAARRELLEETGLTAGVLRLWSAWQPVNKIDWVVYLFVGHQLAPAQAAAPDAGEEISLRTIPVETLLGSSDAPVLDDNEFLYQLNFARSDALERKRVHALLKP